MVIVGGGSPGCSPPSTSGQHGITDIRIVEKAGDFGGAWYSNRYPGCMCDVGRSGYLPLLEETGFMSKERYAGASEIYRYSSCSPAHSTSTPGPSSRRT